MTLKFETINIWHKITLEFRWEILWEIFKIKSLVHYKLSLICYHTKAHFIFTLTITFMQPFSNNLADMGMSTLLTKAWQSIEMPRNP